MAEEERKDVYREERGERRTGCNHEVHADVVAAVATMTKTVAQNDE